MAYVNRRKGIGQYQGPCADPSLVMDPTSGQCVSPQVLQGLVSDYQSGVNYLTNLVGQQTDLTPFLWIAGAFVAISLIQGGGGRRR